MNSTKCPLSLADITRKTFPFGASCLMRMNWILKDKHKAINQFNNLFQTKITFDIFSKMMNSRNA